MIQPRVAYSYFINFARSAYQYINDSSTRHIFINMSQYINDSTTRHTILFYEFRALRISIYQWFRLVFMVQNSTSQNSNKKMSAWRNVTKMGDEILRKWVTKCCKIQDPRCAIKNVRVTKCYENEWRNVTKMGDEMSQIQGYR